MKIEVRSDRVDISGYVNATEKPSRPVITPHGKVIEVIEPRAFEGAIERAGNVNLTVDHDDTHIYADTKNNTLKLYEDNIGLHAEVISFDEELTEIAKQGKIKGWSFGMYNVVDSLEQRAEGLPIRHITALDLDHITLVVNKCPAYSATSVEVRAEKEIDLEYRAMDITPQITLLEEKEPPKASFDIEAYKKRAENLRK